MNFNSRKRFSSVSSDIRKKGEKKTAENMAQVLVESNNVQEVFPLEDFESQNSVPQVIPEWLNEKFVEDALRKFFKDEEIQVRSLKACS